MKKYLILYLLILTSSTKLMASNVYAQLGITPQKSHPLPLIKKEKRKIYKHHELKRKPLHSLSPILKYVKTEKISEEKSKVGATVNYLISKTVKLKLDLTTIVHTKALKQIKIKGEEAHFTFSMAL